MEAIEAILRDSAIFRQQEINVAMELARYAISEPLQKSYEFRVCVARSRVAGFVCFGPTDIGDGTYEIFWIVVGSAFRRRGIARVLLRDAEETIRDCHARLIVVETSSTPGYEAARKFYESCGYTRAAEIPDFYAPGDSKVFYTKVLPRPVGVVSVPEDRAMSLSQVAE